MSDSSSFTLTPPAAAVRAPSRSGAVAITIRRAGVTMTVKCPPTSLVLDLATRLMGGALPVASVQADRGGGESEQATLFESAARDTDEGLVSAFLADRTESAHQYWEPLARLSSAYLAWCSDRGFEPLSHYAFSQQLRDLKFRQGRTRRIKCGSQVCPKCARSEKGGHQTRTWEGLRLRQSAGGPALVVPVPSEAPRVQ